MAADASRAANRERAEWLKGQCDALIAAVDGAPLAASLGALVRTATDTLGEDVRTAFYLADADRGALQHVVGMSDEYARAVDGFERGPESLACSAATDEGGPVIAVDVHTDPRWAPWRGLADRFGYRGCWSFPVHSAAGTFVGALTLYWRDPRATSARELELVSLLTGTAAVVISWHRKAENRERAETALRARERRYRALATVSADVIYHMSPDWREMRQLDGRGFLSDTAAPTGSWLERYIHPDDRATVTAAIDEAVRGKRVFELEHRVVRADGTPGWAFSRAVPLVGDDGEIIEWVGAASDVTARKAAEAALYRSEEQYRYLFESIDEGFCTIEVLFDADGIPRDYRFLEANPAFVRQTGIVAGIGRTMREIAPEHEQFWFDIYGKIARSGESSRFEHEAAALGRYYEVFAFRIGAPADHRIAIIFHDISGRKRAEAALRESEERQAFLLKLSDVLRPLRDPEQIKLTATRLLGEQLAVNRVFYADAAGGHWLVTKGYETGVDPLPDQPLPMSEYGDWIIQTFGTGSRLVVSDMHADARFQESERQAHLSLHIGAEVALPLVKGGELLAMLVAHHATPREWSEREIAMLDEAAERTWAAVQRAHAEAALRESEAKYRNLFELMTEGYAVLELILDDAGHPVDYVYVETNPAFEIHATRPMKGRRARDVIPDLEQFWIDHYGRVALTGEPVQLEHVVQGLGDQWFRSSAFGIGGAESRRVGVLFENITERKRREANQALLIDISADLSRLSSEDEIVRAAGDKLAAHLKLTSYHYADVSEERGDVTICHVWQALDVPSLLGTYPIAGFMPAHGLNRLRSGETFIVHDVQNDRPDEAPATAALKAAAAAQQIGAYVAVPHSQNHQWKAYFAAADSTARRWTAQEVELIQEVAGRIFPRIERARAEAALRASEEKYRTLFASIDEGFCLVRMIHDEAGRPIDYQFLDVNPAFEKHTGIEDAVGRRMSDVVPDPEPAWYDILGRVSETGESVRMQLEASGIGRVFDFYAFRIGEPEQRRVAALFSDVTARTDTELALRASEERLRTIIESIQDYAIITLDRDGRITSWNDGARRMTGFEADDVLGRTIERFHPPDEVAAGKPARELQRAVGTGRSEDESWRVRKDGSRVWVNEIVRPLRNSQGHVNGFTMISRDLTERKAFEDALQEARDTLDARVRQRTAEVQSLFTRLVSAQEEERRRIARDIHDQIGQQMTALRMNLEAVRSQAAGRTALVEQAERTQRLAEELDHSIDFLTWQLRPAALDRLGLSAALHNLVTGWSERFAIPAEVVVEGVEDVRLPRDVEANLYRIAQEGLHNVAKHAHATQVTVYLMQHPASLILLIEDNGRGFDPDRAPADDGGSGMGLMSMRERAALVGGRLDIESVAGHGTSIYVRIPDRSRTA